MTMIDTVVGTALMLVVFVGISGVFRLSVDVVTNNKARAGAIALADQRMEYIRSLAYASVGTSGGIPSGSLAQSETTTLNGVTYTRRTYIAYADDPKDGTGASDTNSITADYKAAKVDVAWTPRYGPTRHVTLAGRFSPAAGLEANPCSGPCGTLVINVVNAVSEALSGASVAITNSTTNPTISINTFTNASGTVSVIGAPAASGYHIVATNPGYSTAQTYDVTSQNTDPNPANLTVSADQTTTGTFAIDVLSTVNLTTYSLWNSSFSDTFANSNNVGSQSSYVEVSGNRARLEGNQPWVSQGYLYSSSITPIALLRWGTFSWDDTRPAETTITYRVYYPSGSSLALVPDSVLPGNSTGFTGTSTDASGVPTASYPTLILGAHLVPLNPSAPSPSIEDWTLTYEAGQGLTAPISVRGQKTIGSGPSGTLYKYDQTVTTNSSGTLTLSNMEWDTYTMSVSSPSGYDIVSSCPTQPIALSPNTTVGVQLYLSTQSDNSLLVNVKNASGMAISGANIQLTKGGSYDETKSGDVCGQAFFDDLTNGNYSLTVSFSGHTTYNESGVNVTGDTTHAVVLQQ